MERTHSYCKVFFLLWYVNRYLGFAIEPYPSNFVTGPHLVCLFASIEIWKRNHMEQLQSQFANAMFCVVALYILSNFSLRMAPLVPVGNSKRLNSIHKSKWTPVRVFKLKLGMSSILRINYWSRPVDRTELPLSRFTCMSEHTWELDYLSIEE